MRTLLGLCALLFLLSACGGQANQQPQPTNVPLPPLPAIGQLPPGAVNAVAMGTLSPDTRIQLSIGLKTNRQGLANLVAAINDPDSPQYGQYLTPDQLAAYGASQADIDTVTNFLTSQGFQIQEVSSLHDRISVSATVLQIAQAFHVVLQSYQMHGKTFFGPSGQFSLPANIQSLITSVVGLNNFGQPHPHVAPLHTLNSAAGNCPDFASAGVETPNQVAVAYNYSGAYKAGYKGNGITIGVVEFGDQVSTADVNGFLACTKGGKLNRKIIPVDGGATKPDSGSTGEATLDLEYLAALAPGAQLLEYQSQVCPEVINCNNDGISFPAAYTDILTKIAQDDRVQVVSSSWGLGEDVFSADDLNAIGQAILNLSAEGILFAAASGDCAAFDDGQYNQLMVDFPASFPYTLAVGGTTLQTDKAGHRTSEPAWSDASADQSQCQNNWGSGGGVSQAWKPGDWQKGPGVQNQYSNGARQVPDVAAIALNLPALLAGQWGAFGGTSIATPEWVAGIALVDQGLKKHHKHQIGSPQLFYQLANKPGKYHPYYDVTKGDNLYYKATRGWDYATGWGAPNLVDFGKALGAF